MQLRAAVSPCASLASLAVAACPLRPALLSVDNCLRFTAHSALQLALLPRTQTLLAHSGHALLFRAEEGQDLVAECEFQVLPLPSLRCGVLLSYLA